MPVDEEVTNRAFHHLDALAKVNAQDPTLLQLLKDWPTRKKKVMPLKNMDRSYIGGFRRRKFWRREIWKVGAALDEAWLKHVSKVQAMRFTVPDTTGGSDGEELHEDAEAMEFIAEQMYMANQVGRGVRSVVATTAAGEEPPDPSIVELIGKSHQDYDGAVLREEVPPDFIIPRGPHGFGKKSSSRLPELSIVAPSTLLANADKP